jgi:hypothetical protein
MHGKRYKGSTSLSAWVLPPFVFMPIPSHSCLKFRRFFLPHILQERRRTGPFFVNKISKSKVRAEMKMKRTAFAVGVLTSLIAIHPAMSDQPTIRQNLYPGEAYRGDDGGQISGNSSCSRDDEVNYVNEASREVQNTERILANQGRAFHFKQNACVIGEVTMGNSGSDALKSAGNLGMFKSGEKHLVLLRYSSGVGNDSPDYSPDVRGLAVKILGVEDPVSHRLKAVDFPMTDSPTPFGRDTSEFVDFMKASTPTERPSDAGNSRKILNTTIDVARSLYYFASHPAAAYATLSTATTKFLEPQEKLRYWAGNPYLLNDHEAIKLNVQPILDPHPLEAVKKAELLDPNALSKDLRAQMQQGMEYRINIQLYKDEKTTPIGDTNKGGFLGFNAGLLKEWKEADSPSIQVGTIVIPPQYSSPELDSICQSARFSPAHSYMPDGALSSMGRDRGVLYGADADARNASQTEVTEAQLKSILPQILRSSSPI